MQAAHAIVNDLLIDYGRVSQKEGIIALSKRFNFATPLTSFVGVHEDGEKGHVEEDPVLDVRMNAACDAISAYAGRSAYSASSAGVASSVCGSFAQPQQPPQQLQQQQQQQQRQYTSSMEQLQVFFFLILRERSMELFVQLSSNILSPIVLCQNSC